MANEPCTPIITVSQEVYDEILLADRVMVVAAGRPRHHREVGGGLPDFFSVRECFLTGANDTPAAALLRLMVGG
jgi:ABC-type molybdate transport system ATPase subunit